MAKNKPPVDLNGFTEVQRRMLKVLSDGLRHRPKELHSCLVDELGPISNVQPHLSHIRKKLRPKGQDIICEVLSRKYYYRWVILLQGVKDE
jgi:hypothetical protein